MSCTVAVVRVVWRKWRIIGTESDGIICLIISLINSMGKMRYIIDSCKILLFTSLQVEQRPFTTTDLEGKTGDESAQRDIRKP